MKCSTIIFKCFLIVLLSSIARFSYAVCLAPPANLVSWWPGDGNANDIVSGNNGVIEGNVTFPLGQVNQSFYFDEPGDNIFIGNLAEYEVTATSSMTVSFWAKVEVNGGGYAVAKGVIRSPDRGWYLFVSDNLTRYDIDENDSKATIKTNMNLSDGNWHHIVATHNGSDGGMALYIDGQLIGDRTETFGDVTDSDIPLRFGTPSTEVGNNSFNDGALDEILFFNRSLSQAEVTDIFNAGTDGLCQNTAPVSNAGTDQSVTLGNVVTLDGSGSTDIDGDTLTFSWSLTSVPAGSTASLSDATAVNPTFTADVAGTYTASLTVNDGTEDSVVDTVDISTINVAPVAEAGSGQAVILGSLVTLDGSASNDADGDILNFSWSIVSVPANSAATLANANTVNPTFTADVSGNYVIELIVSDGALSSDADTVTVSTINIAPVADAGEDQSIALGDLVTLDGSNSSDVDGDTLTYRWSLSALPAGSSAVLSDTTDVSPTFTADVAGMYVASLIVNDGTVDSDPVTVVIDTVNTTPVAEAGLDQQVSINSVVTLDGTQSGDADGDTLTYNWNIVTQPAASNTVLNNPLSATPTFTADVSGTYVISLVVNDGIVNSVSDTVSVSTNNVAPVADAGIDQSVLEGQLVTLDGSNSDDADVDPLSFNWSLTSVPAGSNAALNDVTAVSPSFTADVAGMYTVSLVVNDGTVDSSPASVTVSAVTVEDTAITDIRAVMSTVDGLALTEFKNRSRERVIMRRLNRVIVSIERGRTNRAIRQLERLSRRVDGCALTGAPQNNDWIVTCSSQNSVYPAIQNVISFLQNN